MKPMHFLFFLWVVSPLSAQVPSILWEYDTGTPAFGSAAAADLDQDGRLEIVFTTYTNDGRAHCLNAEDGSVAWIYDIGGCGDVAPLIYDVNNDGQLEVVINGSCNPTVFCLDGSNGDLLWSQPSGGGDSPPTAADIDEDGLPEILFGNFSGEIRILNGEDGSLNKVLDVIPGGSALQTEPTLVDVNQDGRLDIMAANYFNTNGLFVWAYDYETGLPIWTNERSVPEADFHAYHGGAIADIDQDGLPEYVLGSGAGLVYAINLEDGSDLWERTVSASNMGAVSIADVDADGQPEVIFNNNDYLTFDDRIWVLNGADGQEEWSYPITFSSFRGMSVTDLNGNGVLDLVSGHFMGVLRAVEPNNGLLWEINLRLEFENADLFPWFETDHQPLIADFDQNRTLDVFVVAGYGTYQPDSLNAGKAFLLEGGTSGTCPEWLMFRQDAHRSGYLSEADIAASCSVSATTTILPEWDFRVFPNPTFGVVQVECRAPAETILDLTVWNIYGQQVDGWEGLPIESGFNQKTIELPTSLPSGVYLLQISSAGKFVFEQEILLKK